jgi:hypothetical protein
VIEESGENWYLESEGSQSIDVTTSVTSHEEWSKAKKRKKRKNGKAKKPQPFGFARALPKQKGRKRGR